MQVQTGRRQASLDPTDIPFSPAPLAGDDHSRRDRDRKTKKKRKRPDPLWARLTVILGALLMMTSGAAIVGSKALIGELTSGITQDNLLGSAVKSDSEGGASLDGPIDLLLLGLDLRTGWDKNNTRADTIIILHVPATHDQAYLLSIPRDTEVDIPRFDKSRYPGGHEKINAAFYHGAQHGGDWAGGAQLMAQTIKQATGISFDGAAIIDFSGFKGVIDALGTVHMCVDQKVASHHMFLVNGKPMYVAEVKKMGAAQNNPVTYKVGCREMKGWEALDYSRQRYGLPNGDYDRQRHQQQLIKAMAKKAMSTGVVANPVKLKKVMDAAGKAFTLDTGGVPIDDFIFTLKGVAANDLVLLRTNNGTFASMDGGEGLTATSIEMFHAVKTDTLARFIAENPSVIANEK